jgi:hypothetical protein
MQLAYDALQSALVGLLTIEYSFALLIKFLLD